MKPADAANVIHDLPAERRTAVSPRMDDERLADVLEELPEEDQVEILGHLDTERAADVLEEMSPDDAADLIADLPPETAATLLEPDGARGGRGRPPADVVRRGDRRRHDDARAGDPAPRRDRGRGARPRRANPDLPVVAGRDGLRLPPAARDADRPAARRRPHPAAAARAAVDARRRRARHRIDALRPEATLDQVAAHLATYNLVAAPVVDDEGRLLGAVTVDDLLDHMLPDGWRDQTRARDPSTAGDQAWLSAAPRTALDTPADARRPLVRRPTYDADAFGVFAEQFARFMGTARFLVYMTAVRHRSGWSGTPGARRPPVGRLPVHLPDPDAQPAGVVRRSADPARPEPAGERDKVIAEQDRQANARAHADMEFLAREVASLRMAVGEVATRDFLRSELRVAAGRARRASAASRAPPRGQRG